MTLNRVDLPQPEGPITEKNSPGLTLKETSSTAVTGPSGVSKRTTMSFTVRMASSICGAGAAAIGGVLFALAGHGGGRCGSVARLDAHIDDGDSAGLDCRNGLGKDRLEIADRGHRAEALRALRAGDARQVDVGIG